MTYLKRLRKRELDIMDFIAGICYGTGVSIIILVLVAAVISLQRQNNALRLALKECQEVKR